MVSSSLAITKYSFLVHGAKLYISTATHCAVYSRVTETIALLITYHRTPTIMLPLTTNLSSAALCFVTKAFLGNNIHL